MSSSAGDRSYYDLLGVERDASPAKIRAAYLRLLKISHPDLLQDGPQSAGNSRYVAELNVAYSTLAKPDHRAKYDAESASRSASHPEAAINRRATPDRRSNSHRQEANHSDSRFAVPPSRLDRPMVAPVGSALRFGLGFAATVVLAVSAANFVPGFLDRLRIDASPVPPSQSSSRLLDPASTLRRGASRAVGEALRLSVDQAVTFSRRCFKQAGEAKSFEATTACVMFDDAVLMLQPDDLQSSSLPPYFRFQWARTRHLDAISPWGADDEDSLELYRSITLSALLQRISANGAATRRANSDALPAIMNTG